MVDYYHQRCMSASPMRRSSIYNHPGRNVNEWDITLTKDIPSEHQPLHPGWLDRSGVEGWSSRDVEMWAFRLGLDWATPYLNKNRITGRDLLRMDYSRLHSMIPPEFNIMHLWTEIQELQRSDNFSNYTHNQRKENVIHPREMDPLENEQGSYSSLPEPEFMENSLSFTRRRGSTLDSPIMAPVVFDMEGRVLSGSANFSQTARRSSLVPNGRPPSPVDFSLKTSFSSVRPPSPPYERRTSLIIPSQTENEIVHTSSRNRITRSTDGLCGLKNLGNTCFMNAAVQCLLHTSPLVEAILSSKQKPPGNLSAELSTLVKEVWCRNHASIDPVGLKYAVSKRASTFLGHRQHDSHEFLRILMDGLHEELNRVTRKPNYQELKDHPSESDIQAAERWWSYHKSRNDSLIMDLFCGQLKSEVRCRKCKHVSKAFDPFLDLSLELKGTNVMDCLNSFMEMEVLKGTERYLCPECKKRTESVRQLAIWRWPKILVLHLKRFGFSSFGSRKLTQKVMYTHTLDVSKFVNHSSAIHYKLFGVINHFGNANGGHYTACCMSNAESENNQWFEFDDSQVHAIRSPIDPTAAYILFYQRTS